MNAFKQLWERSLKALSDTDSGAVLDLATNLLNIKGLSGVIIHWRLFLNMTGLLHRDLQSSHFTAGEQLWAAEIMKWLFISLFTDDLIHSHGKESGIYLMDPKMS